MNIETIRGAGITIEELRAIGGGAKSDFWLQLKADMYGTKIVRMEVTEAACLGMAMLAATAARKYRDIREAVRSILRTNATCFPDPDRKAYYEEMFQKYVKLYPLLKQFQGLPLRRHGGFGESRDLKEG